MQATAASSPAKVAENLQACSLITLCMQLLRASMQMMAVAVAMVFHMAFLLQSHLALLEF